MVALNIHNEVCDLLDVSQFLAGRSAYECVAYAAALLKYAGLPGQGPTGTAMQASNLAQFWYGKEEGSTGAANTNGMSIPAMENMLQGMGLAYFVEELQDAAYNLALIKLALSEGKPCLVCGHENGFFDMALGDRVPYNWTPSGNHCIVASGIDEAGNLLVHDCANVDEQGRIRPGPRVYDASKMQLVSITAVQIGEDMNQPLSIDMPAVSALFRQLDTNHWQSIKTGRILQFGLLESYKAGGAASLDYLGDVASPEQVQPNGDVFQYHSYGATRWEKATGKVTRLDLFSAASLDILKRLFSVPVPQAPQSTAILLQIAEEAASAIGKKLV